MEHRHTGLGWTIHIPAMGEALHHLLFMHLYTSRVSWLLALEPCCPFASADLPSSCTHAHMHMVIRWGTGLVEARMASALPCTMRQYVPCTAPRWPTWWPTLRAWTAAHWRPSWGTTRHPVSDWGDTRFVCLQSADWRQAAAPDVAGVCYMSAPGETGLLPRLPSLRCCLDIP